jgi:hypothetical protein
VQAGYRREQLKNTSEESEEEGVSFSWKEELPLRMLQARGDEPGRVSGG